MTPVIAVLFSPAWSQYELIDSGDGYKLERFGSYTFIRPEHQAMWSRGLSPKSWSEAHVEFQPTSGEETGGRWKLNQRVPEAWKMSYKDLAFEARLTNSRHFGVFPEQGAHWDWIREKVRTAPKHIKVLNLFGYTGLASLAAAQAGAAVTHVDASKKAVAWARTNQLLSSLHEKPIRWIVEDAIKYVQREERRGSVYDGIIMDPPKFGRGPKGEVWESMEMLPVLLERCRHILSGTPLFVLITAYAISASSLSLYYLLDQMMRDFNGKSSCGELAVKESSAARVISTAIYARWNASEIG